MFKTSPQQLKIELNANTRANFACKEKKIVYNVYD